ncbi:TPA: bacteriocin immunity protein [Yersinia enterocolitica]|nr:bacteriocin immunity protein [Yersinia enterocolitica]HDL6900786.1 bacteriocin immunity protein [Yersinia enterocolitica]HDL7480110.1 bacteriocin immunity protein [Yersinia enterocolitica]HDL7503507.1 bacteriocin immunity protein [Yersinia enterocolitica]
MENKNLSDYTEQEFLSFLFQLTTKRFTVT